MARIDAFRWKPSDPAYVAAVRARDGLRELRAALRDPQPPPELPRWGAGRGVIRCAVSCGPCPKTTTPTPRANGRSLAEVMAESARLKRQSAEMLKRIADLDEQIAARLPLSAPKRPRRKQ